MPYLLPRLIGMLRQYDSKVMFKPEFFEKRTSKAVGHDFVHVKPIADWKDQSVKLGYNVGTRSNGVDAAKWPENLGDEVVQ